MTVFVLVALPAAVLISIASWKLRTGTTSQLVAIATLVALTGVLAALTLLGVADLDDPNEKRGLIWFLAGILAASGGGPLTVTVLWLVDRDNPIGSQGSVQQAGEVLRGGAWIGVMERAAVFATLVAGWPEGLAVVLAVKGVGRYPELRSPGAAERFIIGSFTSVLWATGCAGVAMSVTR